MDAKTASLIFTLFFLIPSWTIGLYLAWQGNKWMRIIICLLVSLNLVTYQQSKETGFLPVFLPQFFNWLLNDEATHD